MSSRGGYLSLPRKRFLPTTFEEEEPPTGLLSPSSGASYRTLSFLDSCEDDGLLPHRFSTFPAGQGISLCELYYNGKIVFTRGPLSVRHVHTNIWQSAHLPRGLGYPPSQWLKFHSTDFHGPFDRAEGSPYFVTGRSFAAIRPSPRDMRFIASAHVGRSSFYTRSRTSSQSSLSSGFSSDSDDCLLSRRRRSRSGIILRNSDSWPSSPRLRIKRSPLRHYPLIDPGDPVTISPPSCSQIPSMVSPSPRIMKPVGVVFSEPKPILKYVNVE